MSMVINTNVQATRTHGVYNRNTSAMNEAMTRVATAQKINSAKDGASVYAISERMRSQIRANDQANQNTQNDSALLKTAQGGIGNTISILNTLKERAINAANDSNLNLNRSDIATEVEQLALQIDDNANKVKFNGRNLLNGAVDNTVGKLNGASAVNDGATVSANPTARSTSAIYTINNLSTHNGTSITAADSNTKLVGLTKANATSAGDTLFSAGDKITFSWKEDGNLVSKDINVTTDTAVSDLAFTQGNLKIAWADAGDDISAAGPTSTKFAMNTAFEKASATAGAGLYLVGEQHVAITDFSVSVTHTDAYGQTTNQTGAQEVLSANGIQNAYTNKTGSNSVWTSDLQIGQASKGIEGGDDTTTLANLEIRGSATTKVFPSAANVTVSVNGIDVTVAAGTTIEGLNAKFKDMGMNVEAHLLNAGDTVTYSGGTVNNGTGANTAALKAEASGLYFVGGDGFDITSLTMSATNSSGSPITATTDTLGTPAAFQSRDDGSSNSSGSSAALTFFVGGEPNFGIDVSINKMTTEALLGTTAETFASKFLTKEGAQTAISVIDNALNRALNEQTKLGAMEARLGYTSDNLSTMNENLEATDSVMRDADLAKEMTNYMKYSVLSQSAQYMLAQAGQNAFSVLNLLQA